MALNDDSLSTTRHRVAFSGEAVAIGLLLPLVARIAQSWICRISSPRLWDYGPGQFAWAVSRLAQGGSLYRDFRNPPYLPIPYNPGAFYLAALMSKAYGAGVMSALEAGRVETIAATAVVCVLIFLLSRSCGIGAGSALIAAFAFLLARLLQPWGFAFRCDMPALACDFAGVYLFSSGYEVWSVAAFVMAFFTRQSEIAGIAAVCLFSWIGGRRRAAATLAITWAGAVACGIVLLYLLVPHYLLNTFLALSPIYDLRAPFDFFERTLRGDFAIPILAGTLLVARGPQRGLPAFFLLTTLGQAMIGSSRWGSDASYFIPPLAAASVLAAEEIEILFGWARRTSRLMEIWIAGALAFAIAMSVHGEAGFRNLWQGDLSCAYLHADMRLDPAGVRILEGLRGEVLTDWPDLLLRTEPFSAEFIELGILKAMHLDGRFDDAALLAAIRGHTYSAVVLDEDLLEGQYRGRAMMWPALKQAIAENYRLIPSAGPPYIMLPASAETLVPEEDH